MKKTKKSKKPTRGQIVKKLDAIFSIYIRTRDAENNGTVRCRLCKRIGNYKDAQNMHFITRSCYALRRDEENCHSGCYRCNVALNGNYIEYTRRMIDRYGIDFVDELRKKKTEIYIIKNHELQEKIEEYKQKVETNMLKFSKQSQKTKSTKKA